MLSPHTVRTYLVDGMSCGHCSAAVCEEIGLVAGVDAVEVDFTTRLVTVRGRDVSDASVRAAIAEAGYDPAL